VERRVETVRAVIDAVDRRDKDALFRHLTPDVEWHLVGFFLDQERVRRGPEDVWDYVAFLDGEFVATHTDVEQIEEAGDRVLAEVRASGKGRHSGVEGTLSFAGVYTFDGERLARVEHFLDMDEARAAIGPG
jgi:ketosteroid isomerase-like protein